MPYIEFSDVVSDITGGMTLDEVGGALADVAPVKRQLKRTLSALPSVKPTTSAHTVTMALTATTYTGGQTIAKDSDQFRTECVNLTVAGAAYPDNQFLKDNATATGTNLTTAYTISFFVYGDSFEFKYKENNALAEIYVDGESTGINTIPSTGNIRYGKVTFASTGLYRIDMRVWNYYLGGFNLEATASMYPTADNGRIIVVGDSFTEGAGASNALLGYVHHLNWMLGTFNIWASGSGGTGYCNPNSAGGRVTFGARLQHDVIDNNPHTVITAGGINDLSYTEAEFQAAVDDYYSDLVAGLPKAKIVIISPYYPKESTAPLAFRDILQSKAAEIGAVFIDTVGDGANGYFTGTGDVAVPVGDGNADLFISSDNTHPSDAGHLYLAHRLGTELVNLGVI